MALSTDSIPTIVGEAILEALRKRLVFSRMFNENYEGEVTSGGSVKIPSIGAVTIGDYSRYTDIAWENVADASQTLSIDQQKYFAIRMDDVDRIQARPAIMGSYASEAAFQLADTMDTYLAGVLKAGAAIDVEGSSTTAVDVTSTDVTNVMVQIARDLDDAKHPREGRVIAVPPWFMQKLVLAGIDLQTTNTDTVANGIVGRYAGFDILLSHNVPEASGEYSIIAGSEAAATMAMQLERTETIRLESQFGDGMRGLAVYGARVTRPDALAVLTATEGTEA